MGFSVVQTGLLTSGSLSGTFSALSLPYAVSLTASDTQPGAKSNFDVSEQRGFSLQAFVTGSAVNGTLALQQSNNRIGWVSVPNLSASIAGANVSQDFMFSVSQNTSAFARLLWSGSAGSGSSITIAKVAIP